MRELFVLCDVTELHLWREQILLHGWSLTLNARHPATKGPLLRRFQAAPE